jgi:hypothetical protein
MNEQTRTDDRRLHRVVHDLETLTDVLENLIERDRRNPPPWQAMPEHEMDFATEWQMETTAEAVHPD